MPEFEYTNEQHGILDHLYLNDGILLVKAGAGCGKTFIAREAIKLLRPVSGLYTAFNKAIVKEGQQALRGLGMECKTFHALAYKHVNPRKSIEDLGYRCITEDIPYMQKAIIIRAINNFFVSSSTDMYEYMDENIEANNETTANKLKAIAVSYIEKMINNEISPTFNFLLKYFHLLLASGQVECKYDFVILDEINDTTAVALEIFKLIQSPKKLGLGETNQAIYEFLNLVDGFEELKDEPLMSLTNSFRCSIDTASRIEKFMRSEAVEEFNFKGTDKPIKNGNSLYCTMTNAMIINEINECLSCGKGFHLLRDVKDIFALPLDIITASQGKKVYRKKHKHLEEEFENYTETRKKGQTYMQYLVDHVGDEETISAVNLLLSLKRKNINIFDLYNRTKNAKVDLKYTIATVFTAKGLEFETVYIADDLNNKINTIRGQGGIKKKEDLIAYRCYYVACSRAGAELKNATCLRNL